MEDTNKKPLLMTLYEMTEYTVEMLIVFKHPEVGLYEGNQRGSTSKQNCNFPPSALKPFQLLNGGGCPMPKSTTLSLLRSCQENENGRS